MSPSGVLRSVGLQGRLVDELGTRIATGELIGGALLSPDEVAADYGVSRTVVREAFRALEARGLISARPRVGTTVSERTAWSLLDPDVITWRSRGADATPQLHELTSLREAIEPVAAALAAARASDGDRRRLEAACSALESAYAERAATAFEVADAEFHAVVVESARNEVFASLLGTLGAALDSRYSPRIPTFTSTTELSVAAHRQIADAIIGGDSDRASTLTRHLIADTQLEIFTAEESE